MEETTSIVQAKSSNHNFLIIVGIILAGIIILLVLAVIFGATKNSKDSDNSNQVSLLPAKTCPDEINLSGSRPSVIYKGNKIEMSAEIYEWVQANCNNKKESAKPVLKNLGISFGKYDEMTGRAGSFVFDKTNLNLNNQFNKIFMEFGSTVTTSDGEKTFPELVYSQVDADTDVTSMADGTVFRIEDQGSDFSIEIRYSENWMVIYDHVRGLLIEEGDAVSAGDIMGKVALNRDGITGFTEVAIKESSGRVDSIGYCLVDLLSSDIKSSYEQHVTELMSDWESFMGDATLYDQANQPTPGCVQSSFLITQ